MLSHRKGVILDGIGSELVRASSGRRKTLTAWLTELLAGVGIYVTATGSTTARTLAARFADVGNVKDFGALGDGSTDDTAAIEAALAVYDSIYLPKGVYVLGSRLDVPAGKKISGAGFDDTILRASATGYNGMTVGNNCVLTDFTIDGGSHGGSYSGILYDGVSGCYTTQISSINWGADGLAITNGAHHNTFGELHSTNNGSRGIIIDPNCYSNQIGSVDTRGSTNSGLLIGHNSYRNQIGLLICGGHQNSALWIHNASYENQVDSVIVEAPATGYEDNSAILFAWGALRNTIGVAHATGWRRGVQFKGDDADATYTDSDTMYNHIGALYVTTDNGANAAGVYLDANNGYYAKHNSIGRLHVKSATYGVYDVSGTNYPNRLGVDILTLESVTTPTSIRAQPRQLQILFELIGADMNSTSDQAFTKCGDFTNWRVGPNGAYQAVYASGSSSSSSAVGGIYSAVSKGGVALVAASQAWSALQGSGTGANAAGSVNGHGKRTETPILSLSTPHGSAQTADFYILGYVLD